MEHEVTYDFEDEEQFWLGTTNAKLNRAVILTFIPAVLEETVSRECDTHDSIDDTLRSYIDLIGSCRGA